MNVTESNSFTYTVPTRICYSPQCNKDKHVNIQKEQAKASLKCAACNQHDIVKKSVKKHIGLCIKRYVLIGDLKWYFWTNQLHFGTRYLLIKWLTLWIWTSAIEKKSFQSSRRVQHQLKNTLKNKYIEKNWGKFYLIIIT